MTEDVVQEQEQKKEAPSQHNLFGEDIFGEQMKQTGLGPLAIRTKVPTFSVLDAQAGYWQERKALWLGKGIESEVGREDNLLGMSDTVRVPDAEKRATMIAEGKEIEGGTSIFDPVLCEIAYDWFCKKDGQVVDPFAGGSVRGIVAGFSGKKYWGCDLREEQIIANREQAEKIQPLVMPTWVAGDSLEKLSEAPEADFIFSCPPYGDLEVYSDDPRDLSQMLHVDFLKVYAEIIKKAVDLLRPDSFACFVVGDFRSKDGFYRNFFADTISAFEASGARLYNEIILATPAGTAAMRAPKMWANRKVCKTHQNVLVFCKGNWKKAAEKINESYGLQKKSEEKENAV